MSDITRTEATGVREVILNERRVKETFFWVGMSEAESGLVHRDETGCSGRSVDQRATCGR